VRCFRQILGGGKKATREIGYFPLMSRKTALVDTPSGVEKDGKQLTVKLYSPEKNHGREFGTTLEAFRHGEAGFAQYDWEGEP